jgi:transcriptional regulator with XRE-family HTH domain
MSIDYLIASTTQIEADLGQRLRRRRVALGLNQTEVAERAGLARRTVSSVERGEGASMATFVALLRALGALDQLQQILPDPGPSPIALTEGRAGRVKERKNPYKARKKRSPETAGEPWKWGDEK